MNLVIRGDLEIHIEGGVFLVQFRRGWESSISLTRVLCIKSENVHMYISQSPPNLRKLDYDLIYITISYI